MDTDDRWSLIAKYVTDECSHDEKERVESDPELKAHADFFIAKLKSMDSRESDAIRWDVEQALKKVHALVPIADNKNAGRDVLRLNTVDVAPRKAKIDRTHDWRQTRLYARVAAVVIILVGVLYVTYILDSLPKRPPLLKQISYEYSTGVGQQKKLLLPDGTTVTMGPVSKFGVSKGFGKSSRAVRLEGEAFFSVKHQQLPFIVRTKNGTILDLGTKFNVKAWPGEPETEVAVSQGRIVLQAGSASSFNGVLVLAGQQCAAVKDSIVLQPYHADLVRDLAWVHGSLVFQKAPLRRVLTDLARQYPYSFSVSDSSMLSKKLTASFTRQPLNAVLKAISLSLDIGYQKRGDKVVFGRNRARHYPDTH